MGGSLGSFGPLASIAGALAQDALGLLVESVRTSAAEKKKRRGEGAEPPGLAPIPEFPRIPDIPPPPPPLRVAESADMVPRAATAAAVAVADSYAAETEDAAVACKPCTMRHLSTMHEAARQALSSDDPAVWREQVAVVAAEALAWQQYDLTPQKLARATPQVRSAVTAAQPRIRALVASLRTAPEPLCASWGALLECRRFAEGRAPTEEDWAQVEERVRDVLGQIGYLESTRRAEMGEHLNAIRPARQRLTSEGPTVDTLAAAEAAVGAAAVALTPEPSREDVERLHRETKAARDDFFRSALGRQPRAQAPLEQRGTFEPGRWIMDRDTALPRALTSGWLEEADPTAIAPQTGLLGSSPQMASAFVNLLAFDRARGVTVRERQLPAGWDGILKGAYNPQDDVLLLGPAATAEDSDGLQSLIHESAHALLHNPRCLPHPTPPEAYQSEYADTVEEQEADAATLLCMSMLGLRIEHDDGTGGAPPPARTAEAQLRKRLDPQSYRRALWAAGVLAQGAQEGAAAASLAENCPVRAS